MRNLAGRNPNMPRIPPCGNVGVSGTYSRPVSFWRALSCAKTGAASSAPTTATGTIGAFARMADSTKPPRPKRRSR